MSRMKRLIFHNLSLSGNLSIARLYPYCLYSRCHPSALAWHREFCLVQRILPGRASHVICQVFFLTQLHMWQKCTPVYGNANTKKNCNSYFQELLVSCGVLTNESCEGIGSWVPVTQFCHFLEQSVLT